MNFCCIHLLSVARTVGTIEASGSSPKAVKSQTRPHIGPTLRFKEKEKMDEKSVFDAKPQAAAWPSSGTSG